jgi:hypothetical protein
LSGFRLLERFRATFQGVRYLHRSSKLGDLIALELYDDLYAIGRSALYNRRVDERHVGINAANLRRGVKARRGDGTFGELVPGSEPVLDEGSVVARGQVATVEIGVEVKIMCKAMVRQVGRVASDIQDQVRHFRRKQDQPICVAIVGINHAERYVSFEGEKEWATTGKGKYLHPYQEAQSVETTLRLELDPLLDHLLIVRFKATNYPPFDFDWLDQAGTVHDCGAVIARIARDYDARFGGRGGGFTQHPPHSRR